MQQDLDPYYRWLGIPPEKQPPDHYALLGLNLFEEDPDVIETAANRQMGHLRTYQTGRHSQLSQKLLNEVAAAKVCLLNPGKKRAYDEALRDKLEAQTEPAPLQPSAPPVPIYYDRLLVEAQAKLSQAEVRRLELQEGRRTQAALLIAGTAIALVLAVPVMVLAIWLAFSNSHGSRYAVPATKMSSPSQSDSQQDAAEVSLDSAQNPEGALPSDSSAGRRRSPGTKAAQGSGPAPDPNLLVVPKDLIEKPLSPGPRPR